MSKRRQFLRDLALQCIGFFAEAPEPDRIEEKLRAIDYHPAAPELTTRSIRDVVRAFLDSSTKREYLALREPRRSYAWGAGRREVLHWVRRRAPNTTEAEVHSILEELADTGRVEVLGGRYWLTGRQQKVSVIRETPEQEARRIEEALRVVALHHDRQAAAVQPVGVADSADSADGFRCADWLSLNYGIRQARLSEKAGDDKVRTKPAPRNWPTDSQGKTVRILYNKADAVKYCSPKRVKSKTYRSRGL